MKKVLLISLLLATTSIFAQTDKEWSFGNAPFGASPTVDFSQTFTYDLLTIATNGEALWSLDANKKTLDGIEYTHRLKSGGGGSPAPGSFMPTTRYLSMNVAGASTINFGMMSSSSSASRVMYITNSEQTLKDSIVDIIGTAIANYTFNYTGGATTLYFYSKSSGINFYVIKATNVVSTSNVTNTFISKGISYNGKEILNSKNLKVEVYNVLGKLIASSNSNITTANFHKGVYLVRPEGLNDVLKISVQ